jgi:hypothetical protein
VHKPTLSRFTVLPTTVQTGVVSETKPTGKPDEAVALIVIGPLPNAELAYDPKFMVCGERAMMMMKTCVASRAMVFVEVSEPANVPAELGVPSMTPNTSSSVRPGGRVPVATENVGAGVPVAVMTKL